MEDGVVIILSVWEIVLGCWCFGEGDVVFVIDVWLYVGVIEMDMFEGCLVFYLVVLFDFVGVDVVVDCVVVFLLIGMIVEVKVIEG